MKESRAPCGCVGLPNCCECSGLEAVCYPGHYMLGKWDFHGGPDKPCRRHGPLVRAKIGQVWLYPTEKEWDFCKEIWPELYEAVLPAKRFVDIRRKTQNMFARSRTLRDEQRRNLQEKALDMRNKSDDECFVDWAKADEAVRKISRAKKLQHRKGRAAAGMDDYD